MKTLTLYPLEQTQSVPFKPVTLYIGMFSPIKKQNMNAACTNIISCNAQENSGNIREVQAYDTALKFDKNKSYNLKMN